MMSLGGRSRVNAFMIVTRVDHYFIHNYIKSLLNISLRPISLIKIQSQCSTYVSDVYINEKYII